MANLFELFELWYKCTWIVQKMSKKHKNAQHFQIIVHFYLLEDKSYLIRSEGNYEKINVQLLDGNIIQVTPIENKPNYSVDMSKIISRVNSIYQYENENKNKYYTLIDGKLCYVCFDNFEQNKQHIKKLTYN